MALNASCGGRPIVALRSCIRLCSTSPRQASACSATSPPPARRPPPPPASRLPPPPRQPSQELLLPRRERIHCRREGALHLELVGIRRVVRQPAPGVRHPLRPLLSL